MDIHYQREKLPNITFVFKDDGVVDVVDKTTKEFLYHSLCFDLITLTNGEFMISFHKKLDLNGIRCEWIMVEPGIYSKIADLPSKIIRFYEEESWETGIKHLRLDKWSKLRKDDFTLLRERFDLTYHQYDEQMEEKFSWWAIRTTFFTEEEHEKWKNEERTDNLSLNSWGVWDKTQSIRKELSELLEEKWYIAKIDN